MTTKDLLSELRAIADEQELDILNGIIAKGEFEEPEAWVKLKAISPELKEAVRESDWAKLLDVISEIHRCATVLQDQEYVTPITREARAAASVPEAA